MHAFDVLSDPVRRRTLELIAQREQTSDALITDLAGKFHMTLTGMKNGTMMERKPECGTVMKSPHNRKKCALRISES